MLKTFKVCLSLMVDDFFVFIKILGIFFFSNFWSLVVYFGFLVILILILNPND